MMLYDIHASIGVIFIWQCPSPSWFGIQHAPLTRIDLPFTKMFNFLVHCPLQVYIKRRDIFKYHIFLPIWAGHNLFWVNLCIPEMYYDLVLKD